MPSFDTEEFMKALQEAVEARGKTLKDLSDETGVSEKTLDRMKRGRGVCDAPSLAALSLWAGINPARFSGLVLPRRDGEAEARIRNAPLRGDDCGRQSPCDGAPTLRSPKEPHR